MFNIKVHAGTATDFTDFCDRLYTAFTTIYGYSSDDNNANAVGWKVTKLEQDADTNKVTKFVMESFGEFGYSDMCFMFEKTSNNRLIVRGYQNYDSSLEKFSTYGQPDIEFGWREFRQFGNLPIEYWIYGNADFIHIVHKNFGSYSDTQDLGIYVPRIMSFGKFIPTYNPAVTKPTSDQIPSGTNITVHVENASIFEPERYVMISDSNSIEKVYITSVDTVANEITLSLLTNEYAVKGSHPILIGEIAKPYYLMYYYYNTTSYPSPRCYANKVSIFPHIGGDNTVNSLTTTGDCDSPESRGGYGARAEIFTDIDKLAKASAVDKLNYDRYMFELYLYNLNSNDNYSNDSNEGFYGKLPFLYCIGEENINSESTIVNDNAYLYRVFKIRNLTNQCIAIRESYK